jgi:transcriptional regulator with XRE-family HTH domain
MPLWYIFIRKEDEMDIGERVRLLRRSKGMTQEDLAGAVSLVDQVYISRLETGRLKNIRPDVLKVLSEVLGVSIEYLLLGDETAHTQAKSSGQPVQQFMVSFFGLSSAKQSQVIDFTRFIEKESDKD